MTPQKNKLIYAIAEIPSLTDPSCPDDIGFKIVDIKGGQFLIVESTAGNRFKVKTSQIVKIYPFNTQSGEYDGL